MTFDAEKQALGWKADAKEDIEFANECFERGKIKFGLFLCHLALEKVLKGLVCKTTLDQPPKIHDLIQLAEFAKLDIVAEQKRSLGKINEFNITGRYNMPLPKLPPLTEAEEYHQLTRDLFRWLEQKY